MPWSQKNAGLFACNRDTGNERTCHQLAGEPGMDGVAVAKGRSPMYN